MSTPEERIARRIKTARRRLGISQQDAAFRLRAILEKDDFSLRTYAGWERAEEGRKAFFPHLGAIAKALDTTEEALLGGENALSHGPTASELAEKLDLAATKEDIAALNAELDKRIATLQRSMTRELRLLREAGWPEDGE